MPSSSPSAASRLQPGASPGARGPAALLAARRACRVLAAAGLVASAPLAAQAQPRNGNIVDGQNRQPTPAEVVPRERAAGVAPGPVQVDRETGAVDQLGKELLQKERTDPPAPGAVPPPPSTAR